MSVLPRYEVIYRDLRDQIAGGMLAPGARLPSEVELAASYSVSRMTVRQALDQLVEDHVVRRVKGSGTYVSSAGRGGRQVGGLRSLHEELGVARSLVKTEMKFQGVAKPPRPVREELALADADQAVRIMRCRSADGQPVAIQDSWLPYALAPQLARESLLDGSLYHTLTERYGVRMSWAEQTVSAATATAEQSLWLQVKPRSPLIAITRTTYDRSDTPVEYSQSWTRCEYPLRLRLEW
jgi:GntR family transcriptional regulator